MPQTAPHKKFSNVLIQGAGRGIGLALARQLIDSDDVSRLFASARDVHVEGLEHLAVLGGDKVYPLSLDVTREASIEQAVDEISHVTDRLDLVIVCAGLLHDVTSGMHPEKKLADVDPENLARAFAVNAAGPLLVLKHCQPLMAHGGSSVFASISARIGSISDNRFGGWYAYRASKAALNQYIRTAAIELRRQSKQTICVGLHPGTTDTALSEPFQRNVPQGKLFTPEFAATRLLAVINGLTPEDSGHIFAWDGKRIPA